MSRVPSDAHPSTGERLRAELDFITELCKIVASNSELQPILDAIVKKTTTMFRAEEGSIRLAKKDEDAVVNLETIERYRLDGIESGSWPTDIARNVMGYLTYKGEPCASADLVDDTRFSSLRGIDTRIRSMLAVPLKVDDRFTGMLAVTSSKPGRQWTTDEIQLLAIVGSYSAYVIDQARLRIDEREREKELATATIIQQSMLPPTPLHIGPWEIAGRVVPARHVGGDAFDYFPISDSQAVIVIADVSGKGVPAALMTSSVQASIRARCDGRTPIPTVLTSVNDHVVRSGNGKFVTMFVAELDADRNLLRYTRAGHNYPMLRRRDGTIEELKIGGFPLGWFEQATYEQGECSFAPGDSLLLYSDGITDQENRGRQVWGEEELSKVWRTVGGEPPRDAIGRVFAAVNAYRGNADQSDDMTLLVIGSPTS